MYALQALCLWEKNQITNKETRHRHNRYQISIHTKNKTKRLVNKDAFNHLYIKKNTKNP